MRLRICLSAVFFACSFSACLLLCPGPLWSASHSRRVAVSAHRHSAAAADSAVPPAEVAVPGPLRSFERMVAISQEAPPENVMRLFALNVFTHGYGSSRDKQKGGKPTEYLILVRAYLRQAKELEGLAGPTQTIRATGCEQAKPLLAILGYQLEGGCGPNGYLDTADADRAFLTIDSGFPLTRLEQDIRTGQTFTYPYASSSVPLLFTANDWTANTGSQDSDRSDVIGAFLEDPALARLYWAMSRLDSKTRNYLKQSVGIRKLLPYGPVLDFYGATVCIRSGHVLVPGGVSAESAWSNLVGASPAEPAKFVTLLLKKDDGWVAAYFDALSRISFERQAYFTAPSRLKTFYEALRGDDTNPGPARAVFRTDSDLQLLVSDLPFDANGQPHVPGNLSVWRSALARMKPSSKLTRDWARRARGWKRPDDLVTAMFAYSRVTDQAGPVTMYLLLGEIDRDRSASQRLRPQTVRMLIEDYPRFQDQYLLFSQFPALDNASIALFLRVAEDLDRIHNLPLRTNATGSFQAEIGLWQILARQGEIPEGALSSSFQSVIRPFAAVADATGLFDAGRASFGELCRAVSGQTDLSQDEFIALLAGPNPTSPLAAQVRQTLADRIRAVMDDQRLVSLDTLFSLEDGLTELAQGEGQADADELLPLAAQLHQFEMPQPIFSARQTADWSYGLGDTSHTTNQAHIDLQRIIRAPKSRQELLDARGLLSPFLRDTLVGLNYAYSAPPGAEMIRNDPFFVRSHDFSGTISAGGGESWQIPFLVGRGWTAGRSAHLAGSLADLPYVLADVEQDFIVPKNVQALIWSDMVPTLLSDAVVPRWWGISRDELHAVALYQRAGEELVAASASNKGLRAKVMDIFSGRMLPARQESVEEALRAGHAEAAMAEITPADTFFLTAEFRRRFPDDTADWGRAGRELAALGLRDPSAVNLERISKDFGVPHPALAFTYSRQLLNVKLFPTFMGYSSRLLAESWESDNLYWARLADEDGYAPVMLNILVPELTRTMIGNIFASYPGDWPSLLRALRQTGREFRRGEIASLPKPDASAAVQVTTEQQ